MASIAATHSAPPGREDAVAHPFGDRGPLRAVGSDQHFDVDGVVGHESIRVQHADLRTIPLDGLTAKQRPQRRHVLLDDRPLQRPLSQRVPTGEPRTDGDGHPARGEGRQRGDRGGVGHGVTKARHEHAGTESDGGRALGGQRQCDPYIRCDGR